MTQTRPDSHQLPDKPSALITLALEDLEKCEADSRYEVDMSDWHEPSDRGHCSVCLAGSVMAKSLQAPVGLYTDPADFERETGAKLTALDQFRSGYVFSGLTQMNLLFESLDAYMYVPGYDGDPEGFKKAMRAMAADFREVGL